MAVFGHSGSQAPQLMHSLVIIVAMGGSNSPARAGVQTAHRMRLDAANDMG